MRIVLDSSALLAFIFREPGGEKVSSAMLSASIGTLNYSEVLTKMIERGIPIDLALAKIEMFDIEIVNFDAELARISAVLRSSTVNQGLSLGDRACLALALRENAKVLTADRVWAKLEVDIDIDVIR